MWLSQFCQIAVSCSATEPLQRLSTQMSLPRISSDAQLRGRFHGCLLGGAAGDALGAPVEFLDLDEIAMAYGEGGIRDFAPAYGKLGSITDDTQMTLFTAEGMLSAHLASALRGQEPDFFRAATVSYARWLMTQEISLRALSATANSGWLLQQRKLFSRRAPGTTCLSALHSNRGKVTRAANDSKGCGGVMRIAPVGMYFAHALIRERNLDRLIPSIFATGSDLAAITHGHPSGCLSAGVLAVIVGLVLAGSPLKEALAAAGVGAIPDRWLVNLELRTTIEALADDLAAFPEWRFGSESDREARAFYTNRYPLA